MAFAPAQGSWRWYQNDAAEPTTALAGQNVEPTLAAGTLNTVIRLRVAVDNLGGTASSGAVKLQASTDNVSFFDFYGSGGLIGWAYGDGAATDGAQVSTNLLTGVSVRGNYHENSTGSESFADADPARELDFSFYAVNGVVSYSTRYYFRLVIGSQIATGGTHPSIISPPAPITGATVALSGASSSSTAGSLGPAGGASVSLTGAASLAAAGAVVFALLAPVTGAEGVSATGTMTVTTGAAVSLSGVSGVGSVGDVLTNATVVALTGAEGTGSAGTVSALGGALVPVVGASGVSGVGAVVASGGATVAISGASSTGRTGIVVVDRPNIPTVFTIFTRRPISAEVRRV